MHMTKKMKVRRYLKTIIIYVHGPFQRTAGGCREQLVATKYNSREHNGFEKAREREQTKLREETLRGEREVPRRRSEYKGAGVGREWRNIRTRSADIPQRSWWGEWS